MSLLLQIGSSILVGLCVAAVCWPLIMRRRLDWQSAPLGPLIASIIRVSPLQVQNGPWRLDLTCGSPAAGLYSRAFTARYRIFALRAPEAVYFEASQDSTGQRLQGASTYCIQGRDSDARWWSLTAYKNDRLIPNVLGWHSFSKTTVARRPDGSWGVLLSPRQQPENWLPSGEPTGELVLILRFYGPGSELISNPGKIELPEILQAPSR